MDLSDYFEAKKRLYPQAAKGKIRSLKSILNWVFLTIYLGSPFLRWDRGENLPNQAILIDFANAKGYFFAIEMWPNEVIYLMVILILAAVSLFFITSLFGRVWCGYACFQTVWTDIFIALEKVFQGDRNARIILDRKNSFEKFYKKTLTHISWIIVALITGYGFTNYFSDAFFQFKQLLEFNLGFYALGWTIGIAGATYIMAGFAREHVCTFMCPYARFQSAMFDRNTLIVAYDEKRGEPRGKLKSKDFSLEPDQHQGDCIECKQCVVVCPTGIDIRDGLQMECIACGLCIDACNEVMEKINRPKGLIRYETQKHLENPQESTKFKLFSARFFYYAIILTAVFGLFIQSLINKTNLETSVTANRNPPFVMLSDGSIRNGYVLKITNKKNLARKFNLEILSPQEAKLNIFGLEKTEAVEVKAESSKNFKIFIKFSKDFSDSRNEKEGFVKLKMTETTKGTEEPEIREFDVIFINR